MNRFDFLLAEKIQEGEINYLLEWVLLCLRRYALSSQNSQDGSLCTILVFGNSVTVHCWGPVNLSFFKNRFRMFA